MRSYRGTGGTRLGDVERNAPSTTQARPQQRLVHEPTEWTFRQIAEACRNFAPAAELGSGSFSVVYGGTSPSGRDVAIKTVDPAVYREATSGDKAAWATTFMNEIELLNRLKHPNLVELLGWGIESSVDRLAVVLELVDETLSARLFKAGAEPIPSVDRLRIALGVARGLTYLHGQTEEVEGQGFQPVFHRDIKSQNIGLMADLTPKLLDFGLARATVAGAQAAAPGTIATGRIVGTVGFMAPEVLRGRYNARCEIYTFGMVLLELATLRACTAATPDAVEEATNDGADAQGLRALMARSAEAWPDRVLDPLLTLINSCIQRRPSRRPESMRHVLISLDGIVRTATQGVPLPYIRPGRIAPRMREWLTVQLNGVRLEMAGVEESKRNESGFGTPRGEELSGFGTPRGQDAFAGFGSPRGSFEGGPLLACSICFDNVPAAASVGCKAPAGAAERHSMCKPCFEQMVRAELGDLGSETARIQYTIRCPAWTTGCMAEPWEPQDLITMLSSEANVFYLERVHEMYLHQERREQAQREEAARQEEVRRRDEVGFHHDRIADLLLLKCPNPACNRAFTEISGCNAVKCEAADGGEYGCGTIFCFVCFQVGNSNQVHEHIRNVGHGFEGERLEAFHRTRRIRAVSQYLRGLDEPLRRRVLEVSLPHTLGDVGISARDIQLSGAGGSIAAEEQDGGAGQPPDDFLCPISMELMVDPVVLLETGNNYDRASLMEWFDRGRECDPLTNLPVSRENIAPNDALRRRIEAWRARHGV